MTASDHYIQDQLNITQILLSDIFVFLRNPVGGPELEWLIGAKSAWQARRTHLRFTADLIHDADDDDEDEDGDGGDDKLWDCVQSTVSQTWQELHMIIIITIINICMIIIVLIPSLSKSLLKPPAFWIITIIIVLIVMNSNNMRNQSFSFIYCDRARLTNDEKSDPARLTNDLVRWISAKLNTTANQTPTDRNGFNTNHSKLGKLKEI